MANCIRWKSRIILLLLVICPARLCGQDVVVADSISEQQAIEVPDSLVMQQPDSFPTIITNAPVSPVDTSRTQNFWHITYRTGEMVAGNPDTALTDYFNRTNVEGLTPIAAEYLGNLGMPMESRIFFERADRSNFMFEDVFFAYNKTPDNYNFINTKIPHTTVAYHRAGSRQNREERFQTLLTVNLGKKLNIGADVDYLYARGFYESQGAKHIDWTLFSNYLSDRHILHLFFNYSSYNNGENGGVKEDYSISHPDYIGQTGFGSRDIPVKLSSTWNQLKGKNIYLNYHYNLGFERTTGALSEEGDTLKQFIPVSALIYTFNYKDKKKRFYTENAAQLDEFYNHRDYFSNSLWSGDSTSYWSLHNTLALSMREGFSKWAKFDLTAFVSQEFRRFVLMDSLPVNTNFNEKATYIGGELTKSAGKILRYDAQAHLGVWGDYIGEMHLSGHVETRIPLWKDTASIDLYGFIKNCKPSFYENIYRSKYFCWDNDFDFMRKVYMAGEIGIPHTNTIFGIGVENITNYIYFDKNGFPQQYGGNIQVVAAHLNQDLALRALHWNNRVVYQKTSRADIIPLPDVNLYSSLFLEFKIAKVLTVQTGLNAHYWTKYFAPAYEPATQQFRLQDEVRIGNYPIVNAFVNCHLKQTRFFLEYYNASSMFISPTEYFSAPHYPVNPAVLKMGVSVDFIN